MSAGILFTKKPVQLCRRHVCVSVVSACQQNPLLRSTRSRLKNWRLHLIETKAFLALLQGTCTRSIVQTSFLPFVKCSPQMNSCEEGRFMTIKMQWDARSAHSNLNSTSGCGRRAVPFPCALDIQHPPPASASCICCAAANLTAAICSIEIVKTLRVLGLSMPDTLRVVGVKGSDHKQS